MLPTTITRSCAITICRRQSTNWGKVTEDVLFKGHANKYFSRLCSRNDAICLNCYTRMSNLLIYKVRKIYTIYYIFPRDFSTTFTSFMRY